MANINEKGSYFPELDYAARDYMPFGTRIKEGAKDGTDLMVGPGDNFCERCIFYYKNLAAKNVIKKGPWPIKCRGDKSKLIEQVDPQILAQLPPTAREEIEISLDPVAWSQKKLGIDPTWYQRELLRCSSLRKVVRAGRRSGKTYAMCLDILFSAFTKEGKDILGYTILVVCPYEAQVKKIFEDIENLARASPDIAASIRSSRKSSPFEITFHNGASIRGFPAARKQGAASKKIRGQGGNKVYLDEEDYMADEDIETIMAVTADQTDVAVWGSSTPTGIRKKYWKKCVDKSLGYKEFHYISAESPRWTADNEQFLKNTYSQGGYNREFNAEFGQPVQGVFRQKDLDACLQKYEYSKLTRNSQYHYVMGVDWNKHTGTHLVMLEHGWEDDQHWYKVVDKQIIRKTDFTQHDGVNAVIAMDKKWKPDYIYVDEGYGAMQIEALWRFDKMNPQLKLDYRHRIVAVLGNTKIQLPDPRGGQLDPKPIKPFMIDTLAHWVEFGLLVLPMSEDTDSTIVEDELPFLNIGLVQQMRDFKVEGVSPTGIPKYSQGYEHTLMALCFATLGMVLNFSEAAQGTGFNQISYNPTPFGAPPESEPKTQTDVRQKSEDARKKREDLKPNRNLATFLKEPWKPQGLSALGERGYRYRDRFGPFSTGSGGSGRLIP
jgi:hypothetical protein